MVALFFTLFGALFSVVNPLGAMPVFLSMTRENSGRERSQIAFRACIFFVLILMLFFLAGNYILDFFGISLDAMRIAGGFIIFLSGHSLMQGNFEKSRTIDKKVRAEARVKEDVSLTPLAIPLLAGPGSISLLISLYPTLDAWPDYLLVISVIVAVGLISFLILFVAPRLVNFLGVAGLNSISRIIGFIVMAIGVQYVITGVRSVVATF